MTRRDVEHRAAARAATFVCRDCAQPADFRCESRQVGPARQVVVKGHRKVIQEYVAFHLCETCVRRALTAPDPPRSVEPLAHTASAKRAQQAKERRERQQAFTEAQDRFGEDWGKP